MITNYHHIYDAPENPIRNFISNSYNCARYDLCLQACQFLQRSLDLGKCEIKDGNLKKHFEYIYQECKKIV